MNKYIMSIDLGTTSVRCMIFDRGGNVRGSARRGLRCSYPREGFVEQAPGDFFAAINGCVSEAILSAKATAARIEGIGITNQRETVILWDRKTGEPVTNAFSWQCMRGTNIINALDEDQISTIKEKTGLVASPYFSASKLVWAFENIPGLRQRAKAGEIAFGTPDSWLIYKLTGGRVHATDYTNASRTMLFDIDRLEWCSELLEMFDIPEEILPQLQPSVSCFGETNLSLFGAEIPVFGVAGDQQAALFGQRCFASGDTKITYGTGCFLLKNTGGERISSKSGLLTTLTAGAKDGAPEYGLEGSIFMCASLLNWLKDNLGIISKPEETSQIAAQLKDNGGVYMVPAFTGLGAPYWKRDARALLYGMSADTDKRHIVRAALESIAFECRDVLTAMESDCAVSASKPVKADGGVSNNAFLMQFQANVINRPLVVPKMKESTALGAAFLAGLGCGFWESEEELTKLELMGNVIEPVMSEGERRSLISGWRKCVEKI